MIVEKTNSFTVFLFRRMGVGSHPDGMAEFLECHPEGHGGLQWLRNAGRGSFFDINKMIQAGKGARRAVADFMLSRHACFLIAMTPFSRTKGIAGSMEDWGTRAIHERKGLKKSEKILDHMGSTELAANLFRATRTEDKLRREK